MEVLKRFGELGLGWLFSKGQDGDWRQLGSRGLAAMQGLDLAARLHLRRTLRRSHGIEFEPCRNHENDPDENHCQPEQGNGISIAQPAVD